MKKKRKLDNNGMPKKKMSKKKKLIIFLIVLLIAIVLVLFALNLKKDNTNESKKNIVDQIENFDYEVVDSDTKLFKDTFAELKKELSKKDIDNEKYASLVSKLFIIDFYTLSNKSNINDVGSVQFVYSSFRTDFVDLARAGIYKQVKSNLDNDRNQDLPEVASVTVDSIEEVVPSTILKSDDFKNVTEANAYQVKVSWTYTKKNNFQTSATMLIVKDGDKLSVAKLD